MVLIQKISESAIVDNLKKRFMDDQIYVSLLNVFTDNVNCDDEKYA